MTKPRPDRSRVSGPLASFADGYCAHLVAQGYSPRSAQFHLQLLAQLSGWMQAEGLDVAGLVPGAVERFWAERRRRGDVSRITQGRLRPLLGYLDGLGMLLAAGDVAPTELDRLLEQFCGYLVEERGLVAGSVRPYAGVARRFLTERSELPGDVGEALADYLWRARPRGFGRTVFLRSLAPVDGLSGDGVSEVVVRACGRAGIAPARAHRLRHTIATEMLWHGAGLAEIGQVLR